MKHNHALKLAPSRQGRSAPLSSALDRMVKNGLICVLAVLSLVACASIEQRREGFKQKLDATAGKPISSTFLRDSADSIAVNDEGERRYYSLKAKNCKWSVLMQGATEIVQSWRYESPPEDCYSDAKWSGPW